MTDTEQSIDFLKIEWESESKLYYNGDKPKQFNSIYDVSSTTVQEMMCMTPCMHKEWLFLKYNEIRGSILHSSKKLDEVWGNFKQSWDLFSPETNQMFKEIELLSDEMLIEWRMKYTYEFPHVYEKEDYINYKVIYNKKRTVMWEEFKTIWDTDPQNYDESLYNSLKEEIQRYFDDHDYYRWRSFLTDSNYHSYDSYSLLQKHEIWNYFVSYH